MTLSDSQIDRYSRQIIIPKFGGRAQERLLASRVLLACELKDAEQVVAYLAGAGVGRIDLEPGPASEADKQALVRRVAGLNPDVTLNLGAGSIGSPGLFGVLVDNAESHARALILNRALRSVPTVAARLDEKPRLVILPERPPCLGCVDAGMFESGAGRTRNAGFLAMVFAVEIMKMLAASPAPYAQATIVEFDGFVSRSRAVTAASSCPACRALK